MIRDFNSQDIDSIMKLWLETNISTHSFIKKNYWIEHYNLVKAMMQDSTIFVYELDNNICGFIGLIDNYIAGIFVTEQSQSQGIGKKLLEFAKQKYNKLSLSVYKKNNKAINFYFREEFIIANEQIDKNTGEIEYIMSWQK